MIVRTCWGDKEYSSSLLELPDKNWRELIRQGYNEEVAQLIQIRNAVRDRLPVIPPEEKEEFIEKIRRIGLEV